MIIDFLKPFDIMKMYYEVHSSQLMLTLKSGRFASWGLFLLTSYFYCFNIINAKRTF